MSYRSVAISVSRKQIKWFLKRGVHPVPVQINQQSALFYNTLYELHPQSNGWTAISKIAGTFRMVIGEYNQDTVRRTIGKNAERECRIIRAAALNLAYDCPRGYRLDECTVIHPGECWRKWRELNPFASVKIVNMAGDHNEDVCPVCKEGLQ